jgi:hypothetical protein
MIPSGQCIYRALHDIGCPIPLEILNQALQNYQKLYPEGAWGECDDSWHMDVVCLALTYYYGVSVQTLRWTSYPTLPDATQGWLLISGIINSKVWASNDPDHSDQAQSHCVGASLSNHEFYEHFCDEQGQHLRKAYPLTIKPRRGRPPRDELALWGGRVRKSRSSYFRSVDGIYSFEPPCAISLRVRPNKRRRDLGKCFITCPLHGPPSHMLDL